MVYTRFRSMLTQEPTAVRLLPLEVVEGEEQPGDAEVLPLYEFEPSAGGGARRAAAAVRRSPGSTSPCCRRPPPSWPPGSGR